MIKNMQIKHFMISLQQKKQKLIIEIKEPNKKLENCTWKNKQKSRKKRKKVLLDAD